MRPELAKAIEAKEIIPFEWLTMPERAYASDKEIARFNIMLNTEGTGRVKFFFKPRDVQFDPEASSWREYDEAISIYSILVTEAGQADLALQISLGLQINSHVYRSNAGLGQSAFEDYMHYIQALCFQAFAEAEEDGTLVDLQSHRSDLWTNKSPVSLLNMPRVLSG
jgi:hypothetical protein